MISTYLLRTFILPLLLLLTSILVAQDPQFQATVSKTTVQVSETFQISFIVNGDGRQPKFPSFQGFQVVSGPNQSSNVQIVNGQMSRSLSYSFYLQAIKNGEFTIQAATITIDNKPVASKPIKITVTASQKQNTDAQNQEQSSNINQQIADNLFVKATVNKSTAYIGEPIILTYKLYNGGVTVVGNYHPKSSPNLAGFWSENAKSDNQLKPMIEVLNGKKYETAIASQYILFPQKTGKLIIEPLVLETNVRIRVQQQQRQRRSIFDDFFGGGYNYKDIPHVLNCNTINVEIKPLPTQGRPDDFSSFVGDLKLECSIDKKELKANEAINLKIKYSGRGNIKTIKTPEMSFPTDFESFDPKISNNVNTSSSGISGSKTFEYLLIPRYRGKYKIPSASYSYFDLSKKEYVVLKTPEYLINVTEGSLPNAATTIKGINKEEIELIGKDIRYIKTAPLKLRKKQKPFYGSPLFLILLSIPVTGVLAGGLLNRRNKNFHSNAALVKKKRATKIAKKRLRLAKINLDANEKELFYAEIGQAMWGYLGDKLSLSQSMLNKENIQNILADKQVSSELIDRLFTTIESSEIARFSPSSEFVNMDKVYSETVTLVSKLEETI